MPHLANDFSLWKKITEALETTQDDTSHDSYEHNVISKSIDFAYWVARRRPQQAPMSSKIRYVTC